MTASPPSYLWRTTIGGEQFLVSSDQSLLDHDFMKKTFASPEMPWAEPLPDDTWHLMIQNTCMLGLYRETSTAKTDSSNADLSKAEEAAVNREQLGFARLITDYVTVIYITDVWVSDAVRGRGLGRWMMGCSKSIADSLPYLRRMMLLTKFQGPAVPLYEKVLDMHVHESGMEDKVAMMLVPGYKPEKDVAVIEHADPPQGRSSE